MIITHVHLVLGTTKGHYKMCSCITQHNATDVSSWGERAIGMLTAWMFTRAVARELNVHVSSISCNWCHFWEFGNTFNRSHNHRPQVTTPAQNLHIRLLHLRDWCWGVVLSVIKPFWLAGAGSPVSGPTPHKAQPWLCPCPVVKSID